MSNKQAKEPLIDFAILTAVEVERRAVCKAFGLTTHDRVQKGVRVYWRGKLLLAGGEFYEVVVAQPPDVANVDAALLTADTIRDWQPGALLLAGIAGAAVKDIALGDIVLGKDVYYYERGKVTSLGGLPEPVMYRADAVLWNRVITLPPTAAPSLKRPDGRRARPKVHQGVIASGERVIAEEAARKQIAAGHRKILAIEMEGYGFSAAAWQSFDRCRHLVIRAICDHADRQKNDDWQPYAAAVAAGFARNFLLDRPLEPRNPPLPVTPRIGIEDLESRRTAAASPAPLPPAPAQADIEDTRAYHTRLRAAMFQVFDREDLKLISADVGFDTDFIGYGSLEYECQRLIDACIRRGLLRQLLQVCRERRPKWFFPDPPQDTDR